MQLHVNLLLAGWLAGTLCRASIGEQDLGRVPSQAEGTNWLCSTCIRMKWQMLFASDDI